MKLIRQEKAKQGRRGVHLLVVLVVSVVLAVAVLWGVERYNANVSPPQPGKTLQPGQ